MAKAFSPLFVVCLVLLLVQSIFGAHIEDNQVIIGSSVGGVLGLVSDIWRQVIQTSNLFYSCPRSS